MSDARRAVSVPGAVVESGDAKGLAPSKSCNFEPPSREVLSCSTRRCSVQLTTLRPTMLRRGHSSFSCSPVIGGRKPSQVNVGAAVASACTDLGRQAKVEASGDDPAETPWPTVQAVTLQGTCVYVSPRSAFASLSLKGPEGCCCLHQHRIGENITAAAGIRKHPEAGRLGFRRVIRVSCPS